MTKTTLQTGVYAKRNLCAKSILPASTYETPV
jgi:hypothetical protein